MDIADAQDPLVPGRYTRSSFRPALTFDVGAGWSLGSSFEGSITIAQGGGSDVMWVQFAKPDSLSGADGSLVTLRAASDAEEILRGNTALTVLEASESRVGGLTGFQVTIENTSGAVVQVSMAKPSVVQLISDGQRLWMAFFDTPDGVLAIIVAGSIAGWDAALSTAEPVLDSVVIQP